MRRATLLLLLLVVLALELLHFGAGRSHPAGQQLPAESAAQARAERLLTLLDFWNQQIMPYVLLQESRARALKIDDVPSATRLERRLVPGLARLQRLWTDAAREPVLWEHDSADSRTLAATGVAWARWTHAILSRRPPPAARLASLEARAVRLDQAAYTAIEASLRAALK